MASKSMALDVLVRLRDQLSSPMRRLTGNLQKLTGFARRIGILGTAVAAISFMGPVQEAAAFQQQLIDIAGTAELSGKAAFDFAAKAKVEYEELALAIGQASETIAAGAGQMIAAGVDQKLIDATIGDIGRAATAANAEFSDMAGVGTAMLNNLKLPADQMRDSLGALVIAGKEGSFELKDMAQHFPRLTSQVAKFGVKGREAVNFLGSALQIAMKGTSDPSIAANNLSNFLSKALSERTIKNFAGMGVDIQAVMLDAASKGINPLEAMLQKVGKLTGVGEEQIGKYMKAAEKNGLKGAEALAYVRQQLEAIGAASKVSELFSDQQVLDFIVPFMANVQEYKDIKEKVAAATGAAIDTDFETQMAGMNRQLTILNEIGTQSIREVGFAFGEWLPTINEWLLAGIRWVRQIDQATGGWMKTLLTGAGGVVLLVTALGALGLVLPIIGAGLGAIGALVGVILSPLGIVIGLLAGAGVLIAKNWDKVAPRLMKFWDGLKDRASKAWEGTKRLWGQAQPYLSRVWSRVSDGAVRAWNYVADAAPRAWSRISNGARSIFANINFDSLKVGSLKVLEGVFNGLQTAWTALKDIGKGIEPSLAPIGESLKRTFGHMGDTWNNLKELGSALGTLASNLMQLVGFDTSKMSGFARTMGEWLGKLELLKFTGLEKIWQGISALTKGLAELANWAAGKQEMPDWARIFPKTATFVVSSLASGVEKLWSFLKMPIELPVLAWDALAAGFEPVYNKIKGWLDGIVSAVNAVKQAILGVPTEMKDFNGQITGKDARGALNGNLVVPPLPELKRPTPANGNNPDQRASLSTPTRLAAVAGPAQSVNVGGDIRIKVDGPGRLASATSDNKNVGLTTDRGRVIGRA
ncbi:phage tail tape measure protein [Brucella anthropi]|uniref:phage tail tape measure protein n=1 Tax=Brucella anthropi TaxID=529 RepID=UPI002449FCB4|nr:phage tail tape measure protein [Brucella anthropi]MDG9793730.1 phage tail tape measure protein [Brucella anthropi]MDH0583615.1 phage tail tape measure protein [Brucella anthropi]MDH0820133.1 phage tail tape measure protein [Brucella anthropi]MDH2086972.1 phage tail tape measure protein [Brucella anthropi]